MVKHFNLIAIKVILDIDILNKLMRVGVLVELKKEILLNISLRIIIIIKKLIIIIKTLIIMIKKLIIMIKKMIIMIKKLIIIIKKLIIAIILKD